MELVPDGLRNGQSSRIGSGINGLVTTVLSKKEIKRTLAMAPGQKAQVMLSLAYGSGMRAGKVVRLMVGDIVSAQEIIRIVQAKGRRGRNVIAAC